MCWLVRIMKSERLRLYGICQSIDHHHDENDIQDPYVVLDEPMVW